MRSSFVNRTTLDTLKNIAPKDSDIYYTIPEAKAVHSLLDKFDYVKVLRTAEGRSSQSRACKQACFLECPSITLALLDSDDSTELIGSLYSYFLDALQGSVIDIFLTIGNTPIYAETDFEVQSYTLTCKIQPHRPCKSESVKKEIEDFSRFFWSSLLEQCLPYAPGSFESYFYPKDYSVYNGPARSLTENVKRKLLSELNQDEFHLTFKGSVRHALATLNRSRALYKPLSYKITNTPPDLNDWKKFYKQDDYFPFLFPLDYGSVCTIVAKDVSEPITNIEETGVTKSTYILFSYFLDSDQLLCLSHFESFTEAEVIAKFNFACPVVGKPPVILDNQASLPKLFSDVFIKVDSHR